MAAIDQFSMALMVAVNLMSVAFALPWFMGQTMSRPARNGQQFLLLQGLAWLLLYLAGNVSPLAWSTTLWLGGTAAATGALWQLQKALKGWLGPRHKLLTFSLAGLCLLTLAGVLALAQSKPQRLAWFSISYALSLAVLASLTLFPRASSGKSWRYLLLGSGLGIASMLCLRGGLALQAPGVPHLVEEPDAQIWLSWLMPGFSALFFFSILLACRDEQARQRATPEGADELTGLPLRQTIHHQARFMLHRARRESLPLALILIDMDHFSRVNHRHGYQTGDEALQLMSRTLQKQMRGDEVVVRWQGEAFCLLVHADQTGVLALLRRIRSALQIGAQYQLRLELDFSAGCVLVPQAWQALKLSLLTDAASIALQKAKQDGRGRVEFRVLHPPSEAASPTSAAAQD